MRLLTGLLLTAVVARAESGTADPSLSKEVERYLEQAVPQPSGIQIAARWDAAPIFESADGAFLLLLRGRVLVDWYWSASDDYDASVTADGTFFRQVRLGVAGHVYRNTIYTLELEFSSGSVLPRDVFVGLQNLGAFGRLEIGHEREPFGLEATTSIRFQSLMERASPTRAFELSRNLGVRLHDRPLAGRLTWWVGIFRESDNGGWSATGDGGYALTAKITGLAIRDPEAGRLLHLGFSFSLRDPLNAMIQYSARAGPDTGPYLVDTGTIAADRDLRFAWAAALQLRAFTVQAEAYLVRVEGPADATFYGWYVMASYWLTGEITTYDEWHAVFERTRPGRNLHDGDGGSGAWMLALRFDQVDLTDAGIDGGAMDSLAFGVTWLWNPNTRVKLNVVYADVAGGPLGSGTIVYLMTRFQFDF